MTIIQTVRLFLFFLIAYKVFQLVRFIFKNFIRKRLNLPQRYGEKSWVMVTGATDGIGKAFCEEFAKEGFNIILVSRNIEKLNKVSEDIKKLTNKPIQTHIIQFDFSKETTLEEYHRTFGNLSDQFDISILVNNVGVNFKGHMPDVKLENYVDMINVNIVPQTLLTKILSESLSRRHNRSAVIDVSSITSIQPLPWRAMYAATKSFNFFLSRALAEEYKDHNIDFICLKPLFVESALTKKKADGLFVISATQCASGTLNDLGYENETYGHWAHKIQAQLIGLIPDFIKYHVYARKK